jgi:hypothetical protein
MQLNSVGILSDLQAKLEKYVMSQANCRWGKLIVIFSILVASIIGGCLPLFSQTQKLLHEETNLFANSKDLNDMKTTFKTKRIHDSYLSLKILGKQWLHLLNYIHQISCFFKLQRKKLGQKNDSFLLLIVKSLYIYAGSCSGSTGFHWFFSFAGLLPNPDQFCHRVDGVPGQPAGPVRV